MFETFDAELLEKVALAMTDRGFRCEPLVREVDGLDHCALLVPGEEFDSAAAIVESVVDEIMQAASSVECPRCHSRDVIHSQIEGRNSFVSAVWEAQCRSCGHKWL